MDEKLRVELPADYLAEYDRLEQEIATFTRLRNRKLRWWAAISGAAFAVALFGAIALIAIGEGAGAFAVSFLVALNVILFLYLFGNLFLVFPGNAAHRTSVMRWDKLKSEAPKVAREHRLRRSTGEKDHWTSVRQSQHQWYGDHSELNWRDRERAQSMGLDVETYVSNVLDRE